MDKGAALNKRVWTLFERAGFVTRPNSQSTAEHEVQLAPGKKRRVDLFAVETNLRVTIIASNKSGEVKDSWTAHVTLQAHKERGAGRDTHRSARSPVV
jgi:hypothetical protein